MVEPIDELIELLKQNKIIPFIGTGVSCASAHIPNWKGLLYSGINYGKKRNLINSEKEIFIVRDIESNNFASAATKLKKELQGFPYTNWIKETFDIKPHNNKLIRCHYLVRYSLYFDN